MTGGGPGDKSQTLPIFMYQQAFKFCQLGYGTAIALVLLVIGGAVLARLPPRLQAGGGPMTAAVTATQAPAAPAAHAHRTPRRPRLRGRLLASLILLVCRGLPGAAAVDAAGGRQRDRASHAASCGRTRSPSTTSRQS